MTPLLCQDGLTNQTTKTRDRSWDQKQDKQQLSEIYETNLKQGSTTIITLDKLK